EIGKDRYTYGFDDLKTIAIARLFLDNFSHIKAYWIMLGKDIAQMALNCGANDIDGTVTEEKISRMAGGQAGMSMSRNDICALIQHASCEPIERDTLYRPVARQDQAARRKVYDKAYKWFLGDPTKAPLGENRSTSFAWTLDVALGEDPATLGEKRHI